MVRDAAVETAGREGRNRWVGLVMLSIGLAMIIVDATIVSVAVPSIINDLGIDSTKAEWVNSVYSLVFAALLIPAGRSGDTFGRRRMYLAGLVVFVIASVLAGIAGNGDVLVAARILQGVGGAMILPNTTSILNANFQGRDRAIAFGIWGATIGGMAAVGPLIGGYVTEYLSWRYAFWINIPIGALAFIGTLYYIRESRVEHGRIGFDLPGFVLVVFGLGSVVFGLIEGRTYGWWAPMRTYSLAGMEWPLTSVSVTPFALALGTAALVLFAIVERRRQQAGRFILMDFSLWGSPSFRYGNLAGTIVSLGEFGILFALPLFFTAVLGYTAFQTGLAFVSLALGSFVSAGGAAPLSTARGPRSVVRIGMALETIGIAGTVLLLSPTTSGWLLAGPLFIYGMGVGFASAQLTSITLAGVPVQRSGLAAGANTALRQVGSALGIAILGTVLFSALVAGSDERLATALPSISPACRTLLVDLVDETAGQVLPALSNPSAGTGGIPAEAVATLPADQAACFRDPAFTAALPQAAGPVEDAFVDAARAMGLTAAGFVLIGFIMTLLLPADVRREEDSAAVAHTDAPTPAS